MLSETGDFIESEWMPTSCPDESDAVPSSSSGQTGSHSKYSPRVPVMYRSCLWLPSYRTASPRRQLDMPILILSIRSSCIFLQLRASSYDLTFNNEGLSLLAAKKELEYNPCLIIGTNFQSVTCATSDGGLRWKPTRQTNSHLGLFQFPKIPQSWRGSLAATFLFLSFVSALLY